MILRDSSGCNHSRGGFGVDGGVEMMKIKMLARRQGNE